MNNRFIFLLSLVLIVGCESQAEKDLRQGKSIEDINFQYQAIKQIIKEKPSEEIAREQTLIKKIVTLNSKSQSELNASNIKHSFLLAIEAYELRTNRQSKQLIRKSGKLLKPEMVMFNILAPWFERDLVTLTNKDIKLVQWKNIFTKEKTVFENELTSLLKGEQLVIRTITKKQVKHSQVIDYSPTITFSDATQINKSLRAIDEINNGKLYAAFKALDAIYSTVLIDFSFDLLIKGLEQAKTIQREIVSELRRSAFLATPGSAWEKEFRRKSQSNKLAISSNYLDHVNQYLNQIRNRQASLYEIQVRQLFKNSGDIVQDMLWPKADLYAYFDGEIARTSAVNATLKRITTQSNQVNRKQLAADYVAAIDYLQSHYQKYQQIEQPLQKYIKVVRGY